MRASSEGCAAERITCETYGRASRYAAPAAGLRSKRFPDCRCPTRMRNLRLAFRTLFSTPFVTVVALRARHLAGIQSREMPTL